MRYYNYAPIKQIMLNMVHLCNIAIAGVSMPGGGRGTTDCGVRCQHNNVPNTQEVIP